MGAVLSAGPAAAGTSVAAEVAAGHLRALGCSVSLRSTADRRGHELLATAARDGRDSPGVACEIGWAGPVDAPLDDELLVQAACGIMHVHGRRTGAPQALQVDYASTSAGVLAAGATLAALIGDERGCRSGVVRTSVAEAALLTVSQYLAAATAADDEWREPLLAGGPPLESADGVLFEIETLRAEAWVRLWNALGADPATVRRGWPPFERRFATATWPLAADLKAAAGRRTFDEIVAAAADAAVSVMRLRDAAGGHAARLEAGLSGRPPWDIAALPAVADPDSHVRQQTAVPANGPLAGIVVVEATRRLQGPLAGHVLGLLGARVIHVEPPGGDPLRGAPPMAGETSARFVALNRLKERVEADIRTDAGREAVRELVAGADVFVHNWAPGKASELRLDASDLHRVRPDLVYAYASAWGPRLGAGPALGTDFMVQAHSGLAAALRPGEPPAASLMTLTDILGGLVCAEGVLGGLLARLRTGAGQRVDSSLLSAATALLEPGPRRRTGARPHHPLATANGWLALSAETCDRRRELAAAVAASSDDRDAIAAAVAGEPTATVLRRLREAGLPAIDVCTDLAALAVDPRFAGTIDHDDCALTRAPWTFCA